MKTLQMFLTLVLAIVLFTPSNGQTATAKSGTKTESFKVSGNCGMCKTRIENAAKMDGVTKAEWNKQTKMATVTFDPAKTNLSAIEKKIAAAGHDTDLFKADNATYDKLPSCCKYR
ncbi:MAG: cation transporter [Marinilabiliales bacterium]|nr:cation transporter [Marinilabiliales bacterium]